MKSLFSKSVVLLIVASFAISVHSCYAGSLHKYKTEKVQPAKADVQHSFVAVNISVDFTIANVYQVSPGEVTQVFKISAPVYTAYVAFNEPKHDNINYQLIRSKTLGLINAQRNV